MSNSPQKKHRRWSKQELMVAFNLYCKLPFGRLHSRNPEIQQVANLLNRTPSALAMKLANFASFDPMHSSRNVRGLSNTSKMDKLIWVEFHQNWNDMVEESESLLNELLNSSDTPEEAETVVNNDTYRKDTEYISEVKVRRGQQFFRKTILASYRYECCVCRLDVTELLVASHIIPWQNRTDVRLDPRNGLCLCSLHDKAFDRGLITISSNYEVELGRNLTTKSNNTAVVNYFCDFQRQEIYLPDKFSPKQEYLEWHRNNIWQG